MSALIGWAIVRLDVPSMRLQKYLSKKFQGQSISLDGDAKLNPSVLRSCELLLSIRSMMGHSRVMLATCIRRSTFFFSNGSTRCNAAYIRQEY